MFIFLRPSIVYHQKKLFNSQIFILAILINNVLVKAGLKEKAPYQARISVNHNKVFEQIEKWAFKKENILFFSGLLQRFDKVKFEKEGVHHKSYFRMRRILNIIGKSDVTPKDIPVFMLHEHRVLMDLKPSLNELEWQEFSAELDIEDKYEIQNRYIADVNWVLHPEVLITDSTLE